MNVFILVVRNFGRHKLRNSLTILGIAIAVLFFGLLRTIVDAWYAGVDASANNRLVTRNAVSFIFPLPLADKEQIARIPGVSGVTFANWFQGVYIDQNQFFARLAIDADTYFDVYPEFVVDPKEMADFKNDRRGCVIGEKLAEQYHLKIGDVMPIEGDIYPGKYEFVVRAVYKPRDERTDATQMLFHWKYIDERLLQDQPDRAGHVGWYVETIKNPTQSAQVTQAIDALFQNSANETKSETEAAFQQGFVSMSGAIITAMNLVSFIIIGVILLVLANTMVMTARERTREYAVLKTLGFTKGHITGLIAGESLFIAVVGGALGVALTFPLVRGVEKALPSGWFPIFELKPTTIALAVSCALIVGVVSAAFPIWRSTTTRIVDGLRQLG